MVLAAGSAAAAIDSTLRTAWQGFMQAQRQSPMPAEEVRERFQLDFIDCFIDAAQEHDVPVALLLSVAKGESNFNPRAVSNKDAVGLMQILWPDTAKHLGVQQREQLFDPCTNINAGAKYLASLLERYKDDAYLALGAYYSGPSRISEDHVPTYADWYADYIWNKYELIFGSEPVTVVPWRPERLLYRFTSYARAKHYWRLIEMDTGANVEVLKEETSENGVLYFYKVVLSTQSPAEEQEAIQRIKAAYYRIWEE